VVQSPLGPPDPCLGIAHARALPCLWNLGGFLAALEGAQLERVQGEGTAPWGGLSLDGKVLRGSHRRYGQGPPALKVLTAYAQILGHELVERVTPERDEVAAALVLLSQIPVAGWVVTQDALITPGYCLPSFR